MLGRLRPDFKTIANFRRANAEALKQVFRDFVLLCRELRLIQGEAVAQGRMAPFLGSPSAAAAAAAFWPARGLAAEVFSEATRQA